MSYFYLILVTFVVYEIFLFIFIWWFCEIHFETMRIDRGLALEWLAPLFDQIKKKQNFVKKKKIVDHESQLILTLLWQYTHENLDRPRLSFCLMLGEKKRKNMTRPGCEPTISRSKVDRANLYSIGPLIHLRYIAMGQKWVLACPNFRQRTARVKLELTDFS